jgi:hypothetical protein
MVSLFCNPIEAVGGCQVYHVTALCCVLKVNNNELPSLDEAGLGRAPDLKKLTRFNKLNPN